MQQKNARDFVPLCNKMVTTPTTRSPGCEVGRSEALEDTQSLMGRGGGIGRHSPPSKCWAQARVGSNPIPGTPLSFTQLTRQASSCMLRCTLTEGCGFHHDPRPLRMIAAAFSLLVTH